MIPTSFSVTSVKSDMASFECHYLSWCVKSEKRKDFNFIINGTDIKVTFLRGRLYYPKTNSAKSARSPNKIIVSAANPNALIMQTFEEYFPRFSPKNGSLRQCKQDTDQSFALIFLEDQNAVEQKIKEDNDEYGPLTKQRWTGGVKCFGRIIKCCIGQDEN